ncbi:hypothetical protein OG2516_07687 [Oceanicola granulosus HTCC2516]|uniref:Uncharacterized protein n=1 Tax=Oceanicola granulosus (strain ATCC BAA-861 / DSM 15982 / KCTC 12143 / HTCC2516) TaxID=314256 RepID=Q2CIB7_OCEGH|nr:hypothetical protein [Oceanicola granulosus]EAR52341.1 hypothetical protein OG2516_07687 [Oceanicola granulosus HTCC2516]
MTPDDIARHFTRPDGSYRFARWGRPIVPVVFGVADESLPVIKGAIEAVVACAGHEMSEVDPETGANLMLFFVRDWAELAEVPEMADLVGEVAPLVARLEGRGATQFRTFRFDGTGAIRACFAFLRMSEEMAAQPAATLALGQAAQAMLLWSDAAFAEASPLALADGVAVLRPDIAAILAAAYDPVLPPAADDASHALRLFARMPR